MTNFQGDEAKKKFFFRKKKKSKWPTQKNWVFQPPPKAEQLSPNFHKLMRRASILLNLYGRQAVRRKLNLLQKPLKMHFLAVNWAYIGKPDNHIGWAKWMPFASINPTHSRTNLWNFGDNCSAFGGGWKTQFFWVGHFEILFQTDAERWNFFILKNKKVLFLKKYF